MAREKKYTTTNLIPVFRIAARARNEMREAGFTDNGGAIASATRILDILGMHICHPELTHLNNYKLSPKAEFTVDALAAYKRGERVFIEHVAPQRALTVAAMDVVETMTDDQFTDFIKARYRLVMLTAEETTRLNRHNRSRLVDDRLGEIGLVVVKNVTSAPPTALPKTESPAKSAKTTVRRSKYANMRIFWTGTRNGRGDDTEAGGNFVLRQVEMAGSDGILFEQLVIGKNNLKKSVTDHLHYDELRGNIVCVSIDHDDQALLAMSDTAASTGN